MTDNFLSKFKAYFKIDESGSSIKTEILAGITTFMTMGYIIVVNPAILSIAGIPFGASMTATILTAVLGTLIMGFYAKRPFAIAPYMGENAFIAYTVVKVLGYSWQMALGAIFISGIFFIILTITKIRKWLVEAIPDTLKHSFTTGIGLFLTFIGLNETKIIQIGVPGAPVRLGDFSDISVLLSIFCFITMAIMTVWRVKGSILITIVITTIIAYILGLAKLPQQLFTMPPSLSDTFLKLFQDPVEKKIIWESLLTWKFLNIVLIVFVMAFVDTIGTLIGLSARAGFLDKNGNLPQIEKPMLADAISTSIGPLLGTITSGAYMESASGIESGGRTGFTAVVIAILFICALFFSGFVGSIPSLAYGPALIMIGVFMMSSITKIEFQDYTESIPSFVVIALMSFTYNIGIGITGGFVLYPFFKLISGRYKEIHPALWILTAISLSFFLFYPY